MRDSEDLSVLPLTLLSLNRAQQSLSLSADDSSLESVSLELVKVKGSLGLGLSPEGLDFRTSNPGIICISGIRPPSNDVCSARHTFSTSITCIGRESCR